MTSLFTQSGVYLCRHADVISKKPLLPGVPGYLIVFKVIKVCIQLSLSLSLFHIKKDKCCFHLKVPISPKFLFSHLILCFMQ